MLCHLIWVQSESYKKNSKLVPFGIKENYDKIRKLNKNIEIITWSNNDILELIASDFKYYLEDYKKINDERFMGDLARLFILYKYGGIYIDIDQECLQSFENFGINDKTNIVLCKSLEGQRISNGFIFSRNKENTFIKTCIENYINDLRNNAYFISACETINNTVIKLNHKPDIMLIENNTKEKDKCKDSTEYLLSFCFFNEKGEIIMRSRYKNYYKDKYDNNNLVNFI